MTSAKTYLATFGVLLLLLAATVGVCFLPLGKLSVAAALAIATGKAWLVMAYFMHVRHSGKLIWIYVGVGFFWLGILLVLTLGDYLTRPWL